ncbi:MAG: MFS transporter [Gammaproteobacteria bacterium]
MLKSTAILSKEASPPSLLMLILLVSFGTVCAVLFTPALPEIADYFQVSENAAQWSMTLYLIGYALGQLPYGPLANRYGRKASLLFGIFLAIIGITFCLISGNIHYFPLFLFGRLLMALGACVGLMMAFTLLSDFYTEQQARKLSSYMMIAFAILPGFSLTLGGFMALYFSWKACFYVLLTYALLMGILVLNLIDNPSHFSSKRVHFAQLIKSLISQMKSKPILIFSALIGCCTASTYVFATLSPFISQQSLHLTESTFGLYSLIPPIGILIGALVCGRLSQHYAGTTIVKIGTYTALLGGIILAGSFYLWAHPISLFAPMAVVNLGLTFVLSNASILATCSSMDKASASSVMSFLNLSLGALGVGIVQCYAITPMLLPLAIGVILCIMMGLLRAGDL